MMEKLQPKLRFPEFNGDWVIDKIETYIDLFSGIALKSEEICDEEKGTRILRGINITEGYIRHSKEIDKYFKGNFDKIKRFLVKENDLVLGMDGSKVGRNVALISRADENSILIQRVARIRSNGKSNINFIYQHIFSKRFQDYVDVVNTSSGIPHISSQQIKDFKIGFPSLPEQQKVASFLTTVDDKINNLKQKVSLLEKYKKGAMQQIFSQQIRFKDTSGNDYPEWEEKSLGDCLEYEQPTNYLVSSTEYSDTYNTPVLTAGKTFILGYTDEEYGVFNQFPVIIFDDFTTATQFVNFSFKAKSSAMKILKSKAKNDVKFLYELMQMINYEIGGHGRHWISVYSLLDVLVPCIEEQTKIAEFLSGIDSKIETTKLQLSKMEVWKKGLLQGMFC